MAIDPITAMAIMQAAIAGGKAIGRYAATAPIRERNREEIKRLQELEDTGQLGLSDTQRQGLESMLVSPLQQAAMASRQRAERIGAASRGQGFGAAELAGMRQEQARTEGAGRAAANAQIFQADQAAAAQQRNELEARMGARSAEQIQQIEASLRPITELAAAAGPIGQAAAQRRLGEQLADQLEIGNLTDAELAELIQILGSDAGRALLGASAGGR